MFIFYNLCDVHCKLTFDIETELAGFAPNGPGSLVIVPDLTVSAVVVHRNDTCTGLEASTFSLQTEPIQLTLDDVELKPSNVTH